MTVPLPQWLIETSRDLEKLLGPYGLVNQIGKTIKITFHSDLPRQRRAEVANYVTINCDYKLVGFIYGKEQFVLTKPSSAKQVVNFATITRGELVPLKMGQGYKVAS